MYQRAQLLVNNFVGKHNPFLPESGFGKKNPFLHSISLLLAENTTYEDMFLGIFIPFGPALDGNS
jgi:hypothetical protein